MASVDILNQHIAQVKTPGSYQRIYKDECVYSFDTPECDTGLYVSLTSFLGFGRNYVEQYFQHTGNSLYLNIKCDKKLIPSPEQTGDGPEKKITRLAIGVEGGFQPEKQKFEYTDHYSLVVLPGFQSFPWPDPNLPEQIKVAIQKIIDAESPTKLAEMEALAGTWDGEARHVSKHSENLQQLDNGVKIPPSGWQCQQCELTTNLWLNLTDGSVLCGRRFFDGTGGNNHAVEHFKVTGYPLAVKLGTITQDGKGDVFSYVEDDMVEDPYLIEHLKHFGINIQILEKTEKSMVELELELNQRTGEWSSITENADAEALYGPALTGLCNLGNSCYLNSVMQVLFRMPDFVKRFIVDAPKIFSGFPSDPANDFNVQTAKLGVGLMSGKYSYPPEDGSQKGIAPRMFKNLVGKNHPDFSTKKQQDAQQFFMYFLTLLERNSRFVTDPAICLRLCLEERVQCSESKQVRYSRRPDCCLSLPVPLDATTNLQQVEEYEAAKRQADAAGQKLDPARTVRPFVPFRACLDAFTREEHVEQFYSSALNKKVVALKSCQIATFPDYLMVQLKKFTLLEDWTPAKLDVEVDMPWEMDLSEVRGTGQQEGEVLLPNLSSDPPAPTYDEAVLSQLADMGFSPESCKRALFFTKNSGVEAATNWMMEHMGDSDFCDPFVPPGTGTAAGASSNYVSEESIASIMGMGFTRPQAKKALKEVGGNVERAIDWIFSHAAELDEPETTSDSRTTDDGQYRDGSEKYKLIAFITHMGTSTQVGHYVCHILHNNQWVVFNDNRVATCNNPPKNLAYLYLYERI